MLQFVETRGEDVWRTYLGMRKCVMVGDGDVMRLKQEGVDAARLCMQSPVMTSKALLIAFHKTTTPHIAGSSVKVFWLKHSRSRTTFGQSGPTIAYQPVVASFVDLFVYLA